MSDDERSKLEALIDIASIDITLDFNDILKKILKITCETMRSHSGTLMLVNDNNGELRMVASYGLPHDYPERVHEIAESAGITLTSSPSGTVQATGRHYLVPNIFEEPKDRPWYDISRELGFSAQIFTPMKRGNRVIGLLNVYMANPHKFTNEEITFVNIAASQAASVVQNSRLCTRLKTNIHELHQHKKHLEENIKETYKKLYDSEKYLRAIIESSFDGIIVADENGRLEYGNNSAFAVLGWPKEKIIGQNLMKVIPEEAHEFMRERWHEIQNGIGNPYEIKIITETGRMKQIYVSCSGTEVDGKKKFVLIFRDISEYKRILSDLKESKEKYRDLFEKASDPMYVLDVDCNILKMNSAGLRVLGLTKEEVIGTNISRWITPESFAIIQVSQKKHLSGEMVHGPDIIEIVCKNGEHRWAEIKTRDIIKDDRVIEIHGIARDITEKRRLEQELKESEEKYRELFENAQDPMYIHDTGGYFLAINKEGLKELDCTDEEEVIGSHISQWLTPESFKYAQETLRQHLLGQPVKQPIILEVITKKGEHKWTEIRNRIIRNGDKVTEIHGIARNITEKRKLEKKLNEYHQKLQKSYEELKEADRMKNEFISNITHELFTPMTSIKGFTELLLDGSLGKITNVQKNGLEIILRNSDRLTRLIKELLDTTQIESDKFELNLKPVSITSLVSRSVQDVQFQAQDKQILIIENIEPLPEILGDEDRLIQVMTNVLSNAIKFTPVNGKITINAEEEENWINISINDTGIGIEDDRLPYIFDRFYQVDSSTKRRFGGLGLGLWICKKIIEKHHGSIWAKSEGKGSTFCIALPKTPDRDK